MSFDHSRSGGRGSLGDRVADISCVCFAVWTLCAHAIVFAGGDLHDLLLTVGLIAAAAAAWVAFARWSNPRGSNAEDAAPIAPTAPTPSDDGLPRSIRLACAAGALVAVAAYAATRDVFVLWWAGLAVLAAASGSLIFQPAPRFISPRAVRGQQLMLWLLAIGCGVLALVSHRYATDDSFYVSVAAATADHPAWALLSWDPLHDPALPLHNPIHRTHSYELLAGAFSYLTRIPAIYVFHWVMAGVVGMLVPLCYARLLRLLTPTAWLPAVIAVVVFLIANGDTHTSYGNYAFVRMWHGKSFMLHAVLPLVYAYALQFASKPSGRAWALLCAAQIAAIGASSSALWIAPLSAGLALVVGAGLGPLGVRTIALGVLASGYPLAVGLALKSTMVATASRFISEAETGETLESALSGVLGAESFEYFGVAAVLLASVAARGAPAQRFAAIVPLGVWLVILNPYWETFTRANITGPSFWRAMWALPVPLLAALLVSAPMQWATRRRVAAGAVMAVALAVLLFVIPERTTLRSGSSFKDRVWIGWPELKIDPEGYGCARLLNAHTEAGEIVIAPEQVSQWVPTFHEPARPIMVRKIYLRLQIENLGKKEHRRRMAVNRFVSGRSEGEKEARKFARALVDYETAAVCLPGAIDNGVRSVLAESGFRHVEDSGSFEFWVLDRK